MTRNRRSKAAIRERQAATNTRYMVARREVANSEALPVPTADDPVSHVFIGSPLAAWNRPIQCQFWARLQEEHGPLIALTISRGNRWWELDDLAREVAGALQDDRPAQERGLWLGAGQYTVTKREHLAGIVAALDAAGELPRLTVRSVPDAATCGHPSCRRRRGEPPLVPADRRAARVNAAEGPRAGARQGTRQAASLLSLRAVMEQQPQLTSFGFGVFEGGRKTAEQRREELERGRDDLFRSEDRVLRVRDWLLANIAPIKTPTVGSYQMKHVVERTIGEYVTNGDLITAALMAGYPMSRPDGPNADFGMSKRDVDRASGR
jgi:hypothetical protein